MRGRIFFTAAILLLGALFLFTALTPAPVQAGPIKLTYANFPPPITFPCVQMERWKVEVEKRTNGAVEIQTFPGGTLLKAKEIMDGVEAGTADIGNLCMAYQPGRFVVTNATALPLGIPNAKVGSLVLWDLYKKYQPKSFAKVKVLTMFVSAPSNLMTKKPVRSFEDIKGMPIRASGIAADCLAAWGAVPVGMPMSQTPEALQKGKVLGLFSSLEVMKDFKFGNLCKYATYTDTVIYPFAVVMNMDKWNSLPDDVKKVMEDLGDEQCLWTGEYMDEHVLESVDWSKKEAGVEFITLENKAEWNAKLQGIVEAWVKQQKEAGYPAEEIVTDIKEMIEKHSK